MRLHGVRVRLLSSSSARLSLSYEAREVEQRWQSLWNQLPPGDAAREPNASKRKKYVLSMFPYPSGSLHMGHVRVYTYSDCLARFYRMQGFDVLHPIGWDSFGLPAENAARDRKLDPRDWTVGNIAHMRQQLHSLGVSFDWGREVSTCEAPYFRWTQWLFLQLLKRGLAYRADANVNWDPVDCTVLANEQVDANGRSWRSGAVVEQRRLEQWFFRITKFAPNLLTGLSSLSGWPSVVKTLQEAWIGESHGVTIRFGPLEVFTTRPETLFGVTFVALAPDHKLASQLVGKTVKHPLTGAAVPVFAAGYVLSDYGVGAVMGVPGHDERDAAFAKTSGLPVIRVIDERGKLVNCGDAFDGKDAEKDGRDAIIKRLQEVGLGSVTTSYKLRDWLVSRQRPWGAPIPVIHCPSCGPVPVPEEQLPVMLAPRKEDPQYETWLRCTCPRCQGPGQRDTDTMDTFVDSSWYFLRYTNPTSSVVPFTRNSKWMPVDVYIGGVEHAVLHLLYARFINMFLHSEGLSPAAEPFTALLTQGMVQGKTFRFEDGNRPVPAADVDESKGVHRVTGERVKVTWEKMSKSKLNGVDPRAMVETYGADATRLYTMFRAPPHMALEWDESGIAGMKRWLSRVWHLVGSGDGTGQDASSSSSSENETGNKPGDARSIEECLASTITQVTADLGERYAFNTAISALMTLSNILRRETSRTPAWLEARDQLLIMLAPLAPHFAAEAFQLLGKGDVFAQPWPTPKKPQSSSADRTVGDVATDVSILIDGKRRGSVQLTHKHLKGDRKALLEMLNGHDVLKKWIRASDVVNVIVPEQGKMVNIVHKKE